MRITRMAININPCLLYSSPMYKVSLFTTALILWLAYLKALVASFPAHSIILVTPPGCYSK